MTEQPPSQFDDFGPEAEWVVAQLVEIQHFLEVARKYGFAVTATPQGRALLHASKHPDVVFVRDTVCPVETDPWSQAHR